MYAARWAAAFATLPLGSATSSTSAPARSAPRKALTFHPSIHFVSALTSDFQGRGRRRRVLRRWEPLDPLVLDPEEADRRRAHVLEPRVVRQLLRGQHHVEHAEPQVREGLREHGLERRGSGRVESVTLEPALGAFPMIGLLEGVRRAGGGREDGAASGCTRARTVSWRAPCGKSARTAGPPSPFCGRRGAGEPVVTGYLRAPASWLRAFGRFCEALSPRIRVVSGARASARPPRRAPRRAPGGARRRSAARSRRSGGGVASPWSSPGSRARS